jgi:hypothetical protein
VASRTLHGSEAHRANDALAGRMCTRLTSPKGIETTTIADSTMLVGSRDTWQALNSSPCTGQRERRHTSPSLRLHCHLLLFPEYNNTGCIYLVRELSMDGRGTAVLGRFPRSQLSAGLVRPVTNNGA